MRHVISVLVENRPGVLSRISGLFSARGYNIESLSVGETEEDGTARMTIVVEGDDWILEQINKQLNKLIDVIKVTDMTGDSFIDRELLLIKVNSSPTVRSEIVEIVNIFRAKIVDISPKTLTVEVTGSEPKVKAIIGMLKPFGIKEMVRTGKIAIGREFVGKV
ncbi:acetolactate synthase small subunit [candidate division KSB1 bacterium]|nr:acetolactate synthase small subunit [bacterium]OQX60488.1 MAG: acetolactate synthase small subunit [candidate division KSB1 bacterium 4484_219]RKY77851.1 MAG: acetolactate synthase small subunit [candidate division KSB1 bacterium]HDI52409.1 acetolactate synthase small subunit [Bacteroidota bacterium]RKY79424.1 MAG: acetolactate synthase small subunit [candidate division KSB1 bacterium]